MRLPVETRRSRIARACLILLTTTALAACSSTGGGGGALVANPLPLNGPQADYPVTIGQPYTIGSVTYRPADVLNYDEVGYATADAGAGVTGGHHTLPVPSYVEVTSLETGRTILVRLERRGPMDSNHLVSLSPRAMAQLDARPDTPVRVRRVNPPENQRVLLRSGEEAPLRMDTPRGLVEVLRRRLPVEGSASLALAQATPAPEAGSPPEQVPEPAPVPVAAAESPRVPAPIEVVSVEPSQAAAAPAPVSASEPASFDEAFAVAAPPAEAAAPQQQVTAGFVVQAGAFSAADRAERVARQIGGQVSPSGSLYRVRTGPFATRAEAEASLANVRAAGYSDARIYTTG